MFKPGILYIPSQGVDLDKFYCAWLNIQKNELAFSRHSKAFSSIIWEQNQKKSITIQSSNICNKIAKKKKNNNKNNKPRDFVINVIIF